MNMTKTDIWRHVEVDKAGLENNPYLNPKPQLPIATPSSSTPPSPIQSLDNYLVLNNISCVDADGNIFEEYPELRVQKDIFRHARGEQVTFNLYNAVIHCEQRGLFLPSFALTCNIVVALYQQAVRRKSNGTYTTLNPDAKKVLDMYKDKGNRTGWHAQNTLINYATSEVIHYPSALDFVETTTVNVVLQRTTVHFGRAKLQDCSLEDALQDTAHTRYVRQLTGLADPAILVGIGNYFAKPAKLWFPWNGQAGSEFNEKRAAWFCCDNNGLILNGYNNLDYYNAARGVRIGAP